MKKKPELKPDLARIIVDCRDGRKDKFIARNTARQLYTEGKLAIDLTNSQAHDVVYCPIINGSWP